MHTSKHQSDSKGLEVDAFLPPEILKVPQWPQSEASATSNMTETHPPLNTMGWWLVRLKTRPEFWKVPLCSTLWCNCFSLNARHSLFDDDDVIFLMILPSVQIFHPKSPELINLLWIKTWCPSSLPHWNQLITNKWLTLYFTIQWKSFNFIVVFHCTKSHEFSVCPKVILSFREFQGACEAGPNILNNET